MEQELYIVQGSRTPFGTFGGSLQSETPTQLGAVVVGEALRRGNVNPDLVDNVVFGMVMQPHNGAPYIARHVALQAGLPLTVPAVTVNRLCGSGIEALRIAAQDIRLGESEVAVVGGAENMSMAPYLLRSSRFGMRLGDHVAADALSEVLSDCHTGLSMGRTAENLARKYHITRLEQDEFAALSHQRATHAQSTGRLAKEIVPIKVKAKKGTIELSVDELIRPDSSVKKLSTLKPVFEKEGTVTAGNSSGINDGASALIVAAGSAVKRYGWKPLVRIISFGVSGVDPAFMGIGPVPAIQQALQRAHLSKEEIDLWEINEAFSAQYLSVERELDLPRQRTNVNGGAIAIGHPLAASGTRLVLTLAYELQQRDQRYGVAALCIGGGQGIAVVIERVH